MPIHIIINDTKVIDTKNKKKTLNIKNALKCKIVIYTFRQQNWTFYYKCKV